MDHLIEEKEEIEESTLEKLSALCQTQKLLLRSITQKEKELKDYEAKLEEISRVKIPTLLNELGLSEVRLNTGEKLIVKDQVKANITNQNVHAAFQAMVEAEGGEGAEEKIENLFKTKLEVSEQSEEFLSYLLNKGYTYDLKKTIHHSTLNKYCRERLSQGKSIPENISVYEYQETTIKK